MKKLIALFTLALVVGFIASAQDTTYSEMVGKYKFPAGTVIEEAIVTLDNGVLNMNSAQGASVLEKIKGDTFNIVNFNGIAVFKRNEIKKITGVHVDASGYTMDGEKQALQANIAAAAMIPAGDRMADKIIQQVTGPIAKRKIQPNLK